MKIINIPKNNSDDNYNEHNPNLIADLKKQFQSCNINIILGAGFSYGVAALLGNIETNISAAEALGDTVKLEQIKKDFFNNCILPMSDENQVSIGELQRVQFFNLVKKILENRQSSILHKVANVFTTNYDLLIETALEKCHADYTDGFSGKIAPKFSTANYGLILSRQTSVSSMTSEITTFNLYKVHGSLNWKCEGSEIVYTNHINAIKNVESHMNDEDFIKYYSELAIVNPSKNKLHQTVLDVNYYDQLRMYCNELEKNNTILLSFGFSFADEHILQLTKRSLKGNPTFNLLIFSFDQDSTQKYRKQYNEFSNVTVFQIVDNDNAVVPFDLETLNDILEEIYNGTK